MGKNIKVDVKYLTRVEGHGNIVVDVKDGVLKDCRFDIVEAPRFFEGMLRGRSIFEAQHITSRICGICACGHTLSSIQAAEDALGFIPSEQTETLRELLLLQENLDSHILHIYLLAAPDYLGVNSFLPLIKTHNDVVRRALRMKKACNDVCEILVGRHIHPISCTVGGFTKLPGHTEIVKMLAVLHGMREDMVETVRFAKSLKYPYFSRETEYVALVSNTSKYPLLEGDPGSSEGIRVNKKDYKSLIKEFIVPHSSAKHAKAIRASYMVGALARINLNFPKLHPEAKKAAEELEIKQGIFNPFLNTAAQVVECVHSLEESIRILEELKARGIDKSEEVLVGINEKEAIKTRAGSGVGAVEVPRGLLIHHYEVDDSGMIINADCIIPTAQNLNNIEQDMKEIIPALLDKSEDEITHMLEMLVRAYDPCISCSTHFLEVKFC